MLLQPERYGPNERSPSQGANVSLFRGWTPPALWLRVGGATTSVEHLYSMPELPSGLRLPREPRRRATSMA